MNHFAPSLFTRPRHTVGGPPHVRSRPRHRPVRIVSGGQTGVDQAGLDAAIDLGLPIAGWCPFGRRTEAGLLDERYPLRETPSSHYGQRTAWNVRDSDGTLIITLGAADGRDRTDRAYRPPLPSTGAGD
ncbi:MAG: putative molybdenum carrier protein [Planctomycetaceae bacterium]